MATESPTETKSPTAEAEIYAPIVSRDVVASDAVEPVKYPNVLADGWPSYLRRSIGTLFLQDKLNLLMIVSGARSDCRLGSLRPRCGVPTRASHPPRDPMPCRAHR
jgi:hypothetical protein